MTDKEIIEGLIDRHNYITEQFLYIKCRPLLLSILHHVFRHHVEYAEMVDKLYLYLMEDDCRKLRQFQYRSTIYQWLKVVATRFFIQTREEMIGNFTKEPPYEKNDKEESADIVSIISDKIDVEVLLRLMPNQRYAEVIRRMIIEDADPAVYAVELGVTVDNLYNIKKRAMAAITRIAIKYYHYGK